MTGKVNVSHSRHSRRDQRMSILQYGICALPKELWVNAFMCRLFHQRDLHQIGTLSGCPAPIKRIQQESGHIDGLDIFQQVPAIPPWILNQDLSMNMHARGPAIAGHINCKRKSSNNKNKSCFIRSSGVNYLNLLMSLRL